LWAELRRAKGVDPFARRAVRGTDRALVAWLRIASPRSGFVADDLFPRRPGRSPGFGGLAALRRRLVLVDFDVAD
jgi:hypothetical protein